MLSRVKDPQKQALFIAYQYTVSIGPSEICQGNQLWFWVPNWSIHAADTW
jgi:hypothetical protein